MHVFEAGFRIRIRIQSGQWIRIEVLDGLFFWELKASSATWTYFMEAIVQCTLQFLIKQKFNFFFQL